jgi:hypothetical protein
MFNSISGEYRSWWPLVMEHAKKKIPTLHAGLKSHG